jgi:hypothetical protein
MLAKGGGGDSATSRSSPFAEITDEDIDALFSE